MPSPSPSSSWHRFAAQRGIAARLRLPVTTDGNRKHWSAASGAGSLAWGKDEVTPVGSTEGMKMAMNRLSMGMLDVVRGDRKRLEPRRKLRRKVDDSVATAALGLQEAVVRMQK